MIDAVLFVCSMNVCRSPLMQWTLSQALTDSDAFPIRVTSRGIDAQNGNAICPVSGTIMDELDGGTQFSKTHASAPLLPADLRRPQLVIVASRAERASIARYAPSLRPLTFTLREANLLGAAPATREEIAAVARIEAAREEPLPLWGYPELLHRRRGTLSIAQHGGPYRQRWHPLDLPDAHLGRRAEHRLTLRTVHSESLLLAKGLLAFRDIHQNI